MTTPSIKKVWLPLGSLPKRALNATRVILSFLDGLGGRTRSEMAVTAAAKVVEHLVFDLAATKVIVNRTDLNVLRPNKSMTQFKTVSELIYNVIFEEQTLPSSMIVKATIRMAKQVVGTQHLLPELKKRLLKTITHFPTAVTHANRTNFCHDRITLLIENRQYWTTDNCKRLIMGTTSLLISRTTWREAEVKKVTVVNDRSLAIVAAGTRRLVAIRPHHANSQVLALVAMLLAVWAMAMAKGNVRHVSLRGLYMQVNQRTTYRIFHGKHPANSERQQLNTNTLLPLLVILLCIRDGQLF